MALTQHPGGRGRRIFEFETSLVCRLRPCPYKKRGRCMSVAWVHCKVRMLVSGSPGPQRLCIFPVIRGQGRLHGLWVMSWCKRLPVRVSMSKGV